MQVVAVREGFMTKGGLKMGRFWTRRVVSFPYVEEKMNKTLPKEHLTWGISPKSQLEKDKVGQHGGSKPKKISNKLSMWSETQTGAEDFHSQPEGFG